ncbi:Rieske (2Fe-2S) protein [Actinopolymorpha pittospori]
MTTREEHVAGAEQLENGACTVLRVGAIEIGVFRVGDHYRAWRNVCPHAGAPVCLGRVEGTMLPSRVYEYRLDENKPVLRCPWHGWEYDLETGEHLTDETIRLKGYPVVTCDDGVYVVIPARVHSAGRDEPGGSGREPG